MPEPEPTSPNDSPTPAGSPAPSDSTTPADSPSPSGSPAPEELRKAMKAFKKRLKLSRLDDEAGLGHGPMSSGRSSGIVAIMPPNQYPKEVWHELVKLGRLKYAGQGLYQIAPT